jgi:hypothetical protein
MREIIAGSRGITDYRTVCQAVRDSGFTIRRVVSGTAAGVDTLAIRYAREHSLPCDRFPAEWSRWGRSAGYRRNVTMADQADALIAVWDGKSLGTKHMIDIAKERGLAVFVTVPQAAPPAGLTYHPTTKGTQP